MSNWILCTNKLPEENKVVLLLLNNGKIITGSFGGRHIGFVNEEGDYIGNEHPMDFRYINSPWAWQELIELHVDTKNTVELRK